MPVAPDGGVLVPGAVPPIAGLVPAAVPGIPPIGAVAPIPLVVPPIGIADVAVVPIPAGAAGIPPMELVAGAPGGFIDGNVEGIPVDAAGVAVIPGVVAGIGTVAPGMDEAAGCVMLLANVDTALVIADGVAVADCGAVIMAPITVSETPAFFKAISAVGEVSKRSGPFCITATTVVSAMPALTSLTTSSFVMAGCDALLPADCCGAGCAPGAVCVACANVAKGRGARHPHNTTDRSVRSRLIVFSLQPLSRHRRCGHKRDRHT